MPGKPWRLEDGINEWLVEFCCLPDEDDPNCSETVTPPTAVGPGLIKVQGDRSRNEIKVALLHGLMHAAERTEDILIDDSRDHQIIDRTCRWLVTAFNLNPKLRRFFFQ